MASESSTPTILPNSFVVPITEKLTKTNYRLWRAQIMPAVRAVQLEDLLTGDEHKPAKLISIKNGDSVTEQPNHEYTKWVTRDQALLGYLLSLLSREVLMGVTTHMTSAAVWSALADMFGSRTQPQSINTRIALATTKKGTASMIEYFSKMKNLADEMVSSGQSLGEEEFVAYVLTGLDEEIYNSLVSSIVT
jgi:hypothetical protein